MIFLDTNVVSETLRPKPDEAVLRWLEKHDAELVLPVIVLAEIAYGVLRIREDQRSARLAKGLLSWRERFSGRIFPFTEEAALAYGDVMSEAMRQGFPMSAPDGMIAAIAKSHDAPLATRNLSDFRATGLRLINPWTSTA